ncbi:putative transmembrane protein 53-like, partial [Capsicum annuum]
MCQLSGIDEDNLSNFLHEIKAVKVGDIEEITNLLIDLQNLNEEAKMTHGPNVLRGLRDQMDSDMISILRTVVDRTRVNMTNGLRLDKARGCNGLKEEPGQTLSGFS